MTGKIRLPAAVALHKVEEGEGGGAPDRSGEGRAGGGIERIKRKKMDGMGWTGQLGRESKSAPPGIICT